MGDKSYEGDIIDIDNRGRRRSFIEKDRVRCDRNLIISLTSQLIISYL